MDYALGWRPELETKAKSAWINGPPRFDASVFDDVDISDPAFTLADQVKFWYNQGQVGSCFANATAQAIQLGISCAVNAGANYDEIQLSRAAVWYFGRLLDGTVGSYEDGGSVTNAVRAIHEYGIPSEKDWPYKPDHNWLDRKPPASVITDAKAITIKGLAVLQFNDPVGIKKTIKAGLPVVIGIWWPYGWDDNVDANGIVTGIGSGIFGHALVVMGWATWNGVTYWHINNSHGPIYHNLSPDLAEAVKGYVGSSDKATYAFWVPDSYLQRVAAYGNSEIVAPVSIVAPSNAHMLSWLEGV